MLKTCRFIKLTVLLVLMVFTIGCSMDGIVNVDSSEVGKVLSRDGVKSRTGALGLYQNALGTLQKSWSSISVSVAFFTDELTCRVDRTCTNSQIDTRLESMDRLTGRRIFDFPAYSSLHEARISAAHARAVLIKLDDATLDAKIAATYAIEGYSILLLAENMCSGMPISTSQFEGDIDYDAGTATQDAFHLAVALFDSALEISHDSIRYHTLASIGKGRAYLGLGIFDSAAFAVQSVESADAFMMTYTQASDPNGVGATSGSYDYALWGRRSQMFANPRTTAEYEMSNREGWNGLIWYSDDGTSSDLRVPVRGENVSGRLVVWPNKYTSGTATIPLARWVEAAMIQAEYYLNIGDSRWIDMINLARNSVSLPDTSDPGVWETQVDLLFHERAYWFFLEGNRLADYRRLVRQYQRNPYSVYPIGAYTRNQGVTPLYGEAFVFSPPRGEYENNYRYLGCFHTNP